MSEIAERLLAGEQWALSRLITLLERGDPVAAEAMKAVDGHTGRAYTVGITGPPGSGKSTIVDQLTQLVRETGSRVGVIAVDPTSPFSGGAVLGDRIRMQRHYLDSGVFIRSVAPAYICRSILEGSRTPNGRNPANTFIVIPILNLSRKTLPLVPFYWSKEVYSP